VITSLFGVEIFLSILITHSLDSNECECNMLNTIERVKNNMLNIKNDDFYKNNRTGSIYRDLGFKNVRDYKIC